MQLLTATREILTMVENITDRKVEFIPQENMPVMAQLRIARDGAEQHILTYRTGGDELDYTIAYQCGFALRLYALAPEKRFNFAGDPAAAALKMSKRLVTILPANGANQSADIAELPKIADLMASWLLLTLRSVPVGMRIDQWLHSSYSELRDQQRRNLSRQQAENAGHIGWRHGNLRILPQYLTLDSAYAQFTDRLLGTDYFASPYRAAGLLADGKSLLDIWDKLPDDPANDCAAVDAWSAVMGVRDWYDWIPFRAG